MKYKELSSEEARKICKKHAYKKNGHVITACERCPLRRTRIDPSGIERTLFCYWRLQDMIVELTEEWEELREEEIKYYKELEA